MPLGIAHHSLNNSHLFPVALDTGSQPAGVQEQTISSTASTSRATSTRRPHPLQIAMRMETRASAKRKQESESDAAAPAKKPKRQGGTTVQPASKSDVKAGKQASSAACPWIVGETYTISASVNRSKNPIFGHTYGQKDRLIQHGYTCDATGARNLSARCDVIAGEYLGDGIFAHREVPMVKGRPATVYRKLNHQKMVVDLDIVTAANPLTGQDDNEHAIYARMRKALPTLYPLAGQKRYLTEQEPSGKVSQGLFAALNAEGVTDFVDAFAGSGYFTLWVSEQQRRGTVKPLRQLMNEWDRYRHNTLRTAQRYPEQFKQALEWQFTQIKYLFYRVLNDYPVHKTVTVLMDGVKTATGRTTQTKTVKKEVRETDEDLADRIARSKKLDPTKLNRTAKMRLLEETVNTWMAEEKIDKKANATLSKALKDYILSSINYPLPNEPAGSTSEDIALQAKNAALYIITQHNGRIESIPVNFGTKHVAAGRSGVATLSTGGFTVENRMVSRYNDINRKGVTGTLIIGEMPSESGMDGRLSLQRVPAEIERMWDALTGVDIRQGDGWELLGSLQSGTVVALDPPYWESGKFEKVRYQNKMHSGQTIDGFFANVDQWVMPGWIEREVRFMVFNRSSDNFVQRMQAKGFAVYPMEPKVVKNGDGFGRMREMMAVNFEFNSGATLRAYVANPAPERLLSDSVEDTSAKDALEKDMADEEELAM